MKRVEVRIGEMKYLGVAKTAMLLPQRATNTTGTVIGFSQNDDASKAVLLYVGRFSFKILCFEYISSINYLNNYIKFAFLVLTETKEQQKLN